jgi:hypothetical protein
MNEVVRLERAEDTFLVIIKLDPMATVPDTARARPIYLSSTMKKYGCDEGEGLLREAWPDVSIRQTTLSKG